MKKILLILALPCALVASEQKDERSTTQKVAIGAVETAFFANAAYRGGRLGWAIGKAITIGDYSGIATETVSLCGNLLTTATATASAVEVINPTPTLTPLEQACKESVEKRTIAINTAGDTLMRCLRENASCTDLSARGIPRRCNSPARNLAMLHQAETDRIVAGYLKFSQQNGKGGL